MLDAIDPWQTLDKVQVGRQSFPGCVVGCGSHFHITDGPYAGLKTEQPVGSLRDASDPAGHAGTHLHAKGQCPVNQLGIDVDAAGGAIGWAMECYQRGILHEKDTGRAELRLGRRRSGPEVDPERSATGRGSAISWRKAAPARPTSLGATAATTPLHIKGQDLYEPCRGANGWLLGTTTSTRGGGHTTGAIVMETVPEMDA